MVYKKERLDVFSALCLSLNYRNHIDYKKGCVYFNVEKNTTQLQKKHREENIKYNGKVWCLETDTGAFVVRRNGKPFISGNSGFPKSLDVSKAIDKKNGKPQPTEDFKNYLKEAKKKSGLTSKDIDVYLGFENSGVFSQHYVGNNNQVEYPTKEKYLILKNILKLDNSFDYLIDWAEAEREVIGKKENQMSGWNMDGTTKFVDRNITAPSTPQAKQWQGWGTALKPSIEPICVARKPLSEKTVAENVLKWGVGAINIDGCRVSCNVGDKPKFPVGNYGTDTTVGKIRTADKDEASRWPANFIHDGSFEEEWSRYFYCAKASNKDRNDGLDGLPLKAGGSNAKGYTEDVAKGIDGNKPVANHHPTVKPTDLMAYLCRLVTPPNGIVLDPFNGSGSTGKACMRENFNYIGIDLSQEYLDISKARIEYELSKKTNNTV